MRHRIILDAPGKQWDDGLLLGNGRLGASVLGQPEEEILPLNEETMWQGGPLDRENPAAAASLPRVRELLRAGEAAQAAVLAQAAFTSCPKYLAPYLPAGNLRMRFFGQRGEVSGYRRTLDLDAASAEVSFRLGERAVRREYLALREPNVLAVRLSGEAPVSLCAALTRRPFEQETGSEGEGVLRMAGQCGPDGVRYFAACRAVCAGGRTETLGDSLLITGAESVLLLVSIATDFGGNAGYREEVLANLSAAAAAGWDELVRRSGRENRVFSGAARLSLGGRECSLSAGRQLARFRAGGEGEAALLENLFAMGKHLLAASSWGCRLPANLQGIWNGSFTPPWESKYTLNINLQMNYWPAEVCGMSGCCEPLFSLIERLEKRGRRTARTLYGCRGSVAHHNTNLWADAAPEGILDSSPVWPMGGAWLSLHLYEHYRYTLDRDFLRERAMPVLRSCVQFFLDYLTPDGDGTLLTGPSLSPENRFRTPDGQVGALCMAPAMDVQILRELFGAYLDGCAALGGEEMAGEVRAALSRLPQTRLGPDGRILEWNDPRYEETDPGHRHISHLFGLYPGSQFDGDPALAEAARRTLEHRLAHGGGHTGWSCAWIACCFARLKDGEGALRMLRRLLSHSLQDNFLDSHPPFQIDGNFGACAAIAEMLVQSHRSAAELLPALPPEWREGSFTGARLRGAVRADLWWKDGALSRAVLTAREDCEREFRYAGKSCRVRLRAGVPAELTAADFAAQ